MKISGLIWLDEIVQKLIWKHSVTQDEVIDVFEKLPRFRFVERGYSPNEDVYSAGGQTVSGRFLMIFFVYKKSREALIISARDMTTSERKRYERK